MFSGPTRSSIVSAIKTSTFHKFLPVGQSIHGQIIKSGFLPETQIFNHLLNMYLKSSDFISAQKLFDEMPERNLVSYSTLISGYSRSDTPQFALNLIPLLQKQAFDLNQFVFSSLILACSKLKWVDQGKQIHAQVIVSDFESDPFVQTSLVDMYSKVSDLESAVSAFGSSPIADPVIYNSMISGFVSFGSYEEALELFIEGRRTIDLTPTQFTFGSVIKACSNMRREVGEQIHGFSLKTGFDSNCFVGTSLVDMYGKLHDMESSEKVFRSIESVDLALYNSMIVGFSNNNLHEVALEFFGELKSEGLDPNGCTFSSVLKACAGLQCLDLGRTIHGVIVKSEIQQDFVLSTSLIDMYMKCGFVDVSCRLFDTLTERSTVLYNSMLFGHGQNGNFEKAVKLFIDMSRQGVEPNHATFIALMNSCLGHERILYTHVIKHGFGIDLTVQNAFLDGLIKGGEVDEAQYLFDKMQERNVVSWTTIISGLSQLGLDSNALEFFKKMHSARVKVNPNSFTFSSVFGACGSLTDLEQGRCIHGCSIKYGIMGDEFTNSSLLDMYAKCGALDESKKLFDELPKSDVVSWNSMITACAHFGEGHEALKLLEGMEKYRIEPNEVTFTSLLTACSHSGLVDEGVRVFESITGKYCMVPSKEHYVCMVDMFGRAGMLKRAKCLIDSMPYKPDGLIWRTLLASCKLHTNLEFADIASTEDQDNSSLVLMSNIYSELGMWDDVVKLRRRMRDKKEVKEAGLSWVQIRDAR
ncbi:Pentatricopeptide repeat [Macleaya cordata]|uniref:Pentatricopeptide repeat n=1 Tax=Macleaya cordata TaxID=56857 RepID=A0A200PRD4_MACCD|nr:Pentatricopeptide repeat [Macleaya cordata]